MILPAGPRIGRAKPMSITRAGRHLARHKFRTDRSGAERLAASQSLNAECVDVASDTQLSIK